MKKIFLHGHMLSTAGDAARRTNWQGDSCMLVAYICTHTFALVIQFPMCGRIRVWSYTCVVVYVMSAAMNVIIHFIHNEMPKWLRISVHNKILSIKLKHPHYWGHTPQAKVACPHFLEWSGACRNAHKQQVIN